MSVTCRVQTAGEGRTGKTRQNRQQCVVALENKSGVHEANVLDFGNILQKGQDDFFEVVLAPDVQRENANVLAQFRRDLPRERLCLSPNDEVLPARDFDRLPQHRLRTISQALRDEAEVVERRGAVLREADETGRGEEGQDVEEGFGVECVEHLGG
jgi:hypothetical protein